MTGTGKSSYAWSHAIDAGTTGTVAADTTKTFHGMESRKLTMTKGAGTVGVANRALSNEGMFFEPKEYEGYFFATSSKAVTLEVRLENYVSKTVLAKQTIHFPGGDWAMQNFSLTPSAGTTCEGIAVGADPDIVRRVSAKLSYRPCVGPFGDAYTRSDGSLMRRYAQLRPMKLATAASSAVARLWWRLRLPEK